MPWRARADLPAELVEAIIVDAEVVADLVDHSPAYLVAHLILGVADGADGQAVDRDPVGQDPGVLGGAAGERHPLVEAEQPGRARAVLDRDGDVAHQLAEFLGQPVQRRGHHLFKPVRINVDHNSFSAGPPPAVICRLPPDQRSCTDRGPRDQPSAGPRPAPVAVRESAPGPAAGEPAVPEAAAGDWAAAAAAGSGAGAVSPPGGAVAFQVAATMTWIAPAAGMASNAATKPPNTPPIQLPIDAATRIDISTSSGLMRTVLLMITGFRTWFSI